MEEESYARIRETLAEQPRDEHQLVVVHPDGVAVLIGLRDNVGEFLVDAPVRLPAGRIDGHAIDLVMEQRPQHAVGKAVVIPIDFVGREENRLDALIAQLALQAFALGGVGLRHVPRPAKPQRFGLAVPSAETSGESPARVHELNAAVVDRRRDGKTIRDDEEAAGRHRRS